MLRLPCLLLLGAVTLSAQPLHFGVKAGTPLTDILDARDGSKYYVSRYTSEVRRYTFGAGAEVSALGLVLGADVLYKRLGFSYQYSLPGAQTLDKRTRASQWEIPVLLKYRMGIPFVKPFLGGGISFRKLSGIRQTGQTLFLNPPGPATVVNTEKPPELLNTSSRGMVLATGLEIRGLPRVRLVPELRYTRWFSESFRSAPLLYSPRNQADFLLGIVF